MLFRFNSCKTNNDTKACCNFCVHKLRKLKQFKNERQATIKKNVKVLIHLLKKRHKDILLADISSLIPPSNMTTSSTAVDTTMQTEPNNNN